MLQRRIAVVDSTARWRRSSLEDLVAEVEDTRPTPTLKTRGAFFGGSVQQIIKRLPTENHSVLNSVKKRMQ